VMLSVLTLIGVSSMRSSSMELKAVANAKQHAIAFNVTQSALEYAVSADGADEIDFQINDPLVTQTVTPTVANGGAISADAVFSGCGSASGNSLQTGKGFSYNFFDITATGSNTAETATSVQSQGIRFPSASC